MAHTNRDGVFFSGWTRALCLCVCLLCLCAQARAESVPRPVAAGRIQDDLPCRRYFDWMLDPGGKLDIRDIASSSLRDAFAPLNAAFPPHEAGTLWLRLTLGARPPEARSPVLLLDMGDGLPGTPLLFVSGQDALANVPERRDVLPGRRAVFLLPETQAVPLTVYVRLEGLPDPWFSPVLRTPHNAAVAPERLARPATLAALGVIMLLCLLRGLTERGQWRIWTGLYTAAVLVHVLWGMPAAPEGSVLMRDLPGVLAPGIALMLLPHVGRHLMRTRDSARFLDIQFILLSLPGALLALLPLVPGRAWTAYYLALWPACTVLFVPTALGAWLSDLPGARRFLSACLAPPLGVAAGVAGMHIFAPLPLLSSAPLWGAALSALFIAGLAAPKEYERKNDVEEEAPVAGGGGKESGLNVPKPQPSARPDSGMRDSEMLLLEEPGLRLVPPSEARGKEEPPPRPAAASPESGAEREREGEIRSLEKRLRPLLDALVRESGDICLCALPPAARQHAETVRRLGHDIAALFSAPRPTKSPDAGASPALFDLQQLLRNVHDQAAGDAERKGLSISWFMPPHLPQYYYGDAEKLAAVLRRLLENAVRAAGGKGFVQLSVRRVPESVDPGHLLFSVSGIGSAVPLNGRDVPALAQVWELADAHGGSVNVESSPHGAVVSFTLHLSTRQTAAEPAYARRSAPPPRVIVMDAAAGSRRLLGFFLEDLPCSVLEARSGEEAVKLHVGERADLLLLDCGMPEEEHLEALAALRDGEKAEGLAPLPVLALESGEERWNGLHALGSVHLLSKPVTRKELRECVLRILGAETAEFGPSEEASAEEDPVDLPPPIVYGSGRPPEKPQPFVPLSLDRQLDVSARTDPPGPGAAPPLRSEFPAPETRSAQHPPLPRPDHARKMSAPLHGGQAQSATQPYAAFPAASAYASERTFRDHSALSGQFEEWVGEPVPLVRPQTPLLRPFDREALVSEAEAADDREEEEQTETSRSGGANAPEQGVLLDWVNGVRPAATRQTPRFPAEAGAWRQTSVRHRGVPSFGLSSSGDMPFQSAVHSSAPIDADEWVGEPVPVPKAPANRATSVPPVSAASPPFPAPHAPGVVFVPERRATGIRAAAAPDRGQFAPLRLTDASPVRDDAKKKKSSGLLSLLFPGDSSLLGFVLGERAVRRDRGEVETQVPTPVPAPEAHPRPAAGERALPVHTPGPVPGHAREKTGNGLTGGGAFAHQVQPLIPGLLASLDEAMGDARRGFSMADTIAVEEAAARIAARADTYGLRILARMARCVEMAAKARDKDALADILPDLESAVERNKIALTPKH
jgi:CheY-like chemotaxis protein